MPTPDWQSIEELLKPDYPTHPLRDWAAARRIARHAAELAEGETLDMDRMHLLCWFCFLRHCAPEPAYRTKWMRPLREAGVPLETQMWLWMALQRFLTTPETPEERVVHDAYNLEKTGALGLARAFRQGGEDGKQFEEIVQDAKKALDGTSFLTPAGRRLGIRRMVTARRFIKELEEE
jgi:hypothetical protein